MNSDVRRLLIPSFVALAVALLALILTQSNPSEPPAEPRDLIVYLSRHAEKTTGGPDPALSPAGKERASQLAHVLGLVSLDAVYATSFRRTQSTAKPTAAAHGLSVQSYSATDSSQFAKTLWDKHAKPSKPGGAHVLVIGHSNTLDDLAAALGAPGLSELSEAEYDRLIAIHRHGERVTVEQLRFGRPAP